MSHRPDPTRGLPTPSPTLLAAAGLIWALAAPASAQEALPEVPPELAEVRQALDKYQDPYTAVRDLYLSTVGCVVYPRGGEEGEVPYEPGAMGVHFLNVPALLDGGKLDPERPEVLVYNRMEDGTLRLVAAEWMVPMQAADGRPTLFGREFDGPMVGHSPLMPEELHHYDLHVWLWRENPAGLFAPTNPAMKCAGSPHTVEEEAPALVETSKDGG